MRSTCTPRLRNRAQRADFPLALASQPIRAVLAQIPTATVVGLEALAVQVEVDVSFGLPFFAMVGLPDAGVKEGRDRVRAAIRNSGFEFPQRRITVNFAPADVRKAGSAFDLPIALGVLAAAELIPRCEVPGLAVVGELSLDGAILPARGVLPIAAGLRRRGARALLLPAANVAEGAVVDGLSLLPATTLADAARWLGMPPEAWPAPAPRAGPGDVRPGRPRPRRPARPDRWRGGRWRSRRPAATTCWSSDRPVPARRCWRAASPASCRR